MLLLPKQIKTFYSHKEDESLITNNVKKMDPIYCKIRGKV